MTNITGNRFQNYSGPAGLNRGGNGKFTPSQTEERLKQHAISIALGKPTIAEIVDIWKEKFGISISLQSEKEWRKNNREKIDKKSLELIEQGVIEVPTIGEEALSNSVYDNTIAISKLLRETRSKASTYLRKIQVDENISSGELKERVDVFKVLVDSVDKLNNSFLKHTDLLFNMSGKIQAKDHEIRKLVDSKIEQALIERDEASEVSPLDIEVTDDLRRALEAQEGP